MIVKMTPEQEYARQLKIARQRDKTCWDELEDLASENEGRSIKNSYIIRYNYTLLYN